MSSFLVQYERLQALDSWTISSGEVSSNVQWENPFLVAWAADIPVWELLVLSARPYSTMDQARKSAQGGVSHT